MSLFNGNIVKSKRIPYTIPGSKAWNINGIRREWQKGREATEGGESERLRYGFQVKEKGPPTITAEGLGLDCPGSGQVEIRRRLHGNRCC